MRSLVVELDVSSLQEELDVSLLQEELDFARLVRESLSFCLSLGECLRELAWLC